MLTNNFLESESGELKAPRGTYKEEGEGVSPRSHYRAHECLKDGSFFAHGTMTSLVGHSFFGQRLTKCARAVLA